jgi:hypothetical protein
MLAHAGAADESLSVLLLFAGLWVGWVGWSRLKGRGFPRLSTSGAVVLIAAGVALAISAAVMPRALFPPTPVSQASSAPAGVRPSSTASLSFERPVANQRTTGDQLDVVLNLQGGRIVATSSTTLTPDTGHIHLSVDGAVVSMTYGLVQAVDLRGLQPGEHTLEAEYVAADHGPFDPRITTNLRFETGSST